MTSTTATTSDATYTPAPLADFVLPFEMPDLGLRGRFLRLDSVSSRALSAHPLPEPAQRVLAEALVLAGLLGSALKFEGRLSGLLCPGQGGGRAARLCAAR
jgi:redox-regulated HSP33 family molecular chaperone